MSPGPSTYGNLSSRQPSGYPSPLLRRNRARAAAVGVGILTCNNGDHAKTCKHHTGATKAHDWACERLATCLRSTGTKVKTQGAVTAVDGNKRGDLELVGYIGDGAQDLVLDISFRHYRGGAAPRNWHRNGELLHPGNPDKDLDEKAASKIAKYRELYRDHRRQLDFLPAIASTSGRIHCELLRLLFLHAHRETTRFFEIFEDHMSGRVNWTCEAPRLAPRRSMPCPGCSVDGDRSSR